MSYFITPILIALEPQQLTLLFVALISLTGVVFSSVFGFISSYSGSKRSAVNESKRLKEAHEKRLEQENKFEKDRILRVALQDLTRGYYNDSFNTDVISSYFNTEEGMNMFYDVMSKITAYGSEDSVHTVIYLQKAISGSRLLKQKQTQILERAGNEIPFSIDWVRYEINALTSIMIAQLRYDISSELINPKELLSVKFNNLNRNFRVFFETGIDEFLILNKLDHFTNKETEQ